MNRMLILFPLLGSGCGFFYLFLALCNLRSEMENSLLRERRLLLERDRKLIILEASRISSFKNLSEVYSALSHAPKEGMTFLPDRKEEPILSIGSERLATSNEKQEKETAERNGTVSLFSARTLPPNSSTLINR